MLENYGNLAFSGLQEHDSVIHRCISILRIQSTSLCSTGIIDMPRPRPRPRVGEERGGSGRVKRQGPEGEEREGGGEGRPGRAEERSGGGGGGRRRGGGEETAEDGEEEGEGGEEDEEEEEEDEGPALKSAAEEEDEAGPTRQKAENGASA
ncbi:hypothetical protein MG293_015737 [Ovis ammon polii]|uniref:Uncharacterized protein n=1 Tax=Ovis ammon polii TaxID=230172 RepID=A0AAD4TY95_OVIAM|nr:hypothetical protein MG293_015737 [Ovis ammon polii]